MLIANRNGMVVSKLDLQLFRGLVDGSITGDITAEMLNGITQIKSAGNRGIFAGTTITSIEIPTTCTAIGTYAFQNCGQLRSIVVPGTVSAIPDHMLCYCTSLTSVVLGEGITGFGTLNSGGWVFEGCTSLHEVVFPDSISNYSSYQCFQNSSVTHVTFGTGCTAINGKFFENSRYVVDVTFRGMSMAAVQGMADYPWQLNQHSGRTITFHCTDGDFTLTT